MNLLEMSDITMGSGALDTSDETALRRIVILGTCGSGKSTLAKQLVRRSRSSHVELDALSANRAVGGQP